MVDRVSPQDLPSPYLVDSSPHANDRSANAPIPRWLLPPNDHPRGCYPDSARLSPLTCPSTDSIRPTSRPWQTRPDAEGWEQLCGESTARQQTRAALESAVLGVKC